MKVIELTAIDCFVFKSGEFVAAIGNSECFELSIISTDNNRMTVGVEHVTKHHQKISEKNRMRQEIKDLERKIFEQECYLSHSLKNAKEIETRLPDLREQVSKLKKEFEKMV